MEYTPKGMVKAVVFLTRVVKFVRVKRASLLQQRVDLIQKSFTSFGQLTLPPRRNDIVERHDKTLRLGNHIFQLAPFFSKNKTRRVNLISRLRVISLDVS